MGTNINYVGPLNGLPEDAYARVARAVNIEHLKHFYRIRNVDFDLLPGRLGNFGGKNSVYNHN